MTTQCGDKLVNYFVDLHLAEYHVVNIYAGTYGCFEDYEFKFILEKDGQVINSTCWKGYIGDFVLSEQGTLLLRSVQNLRRSVQIVDEELLGNFWCVLESYNAIDDVLHLSIEFENGKIVDKTRWRSHPSTPDEQTAITVAKAPMSSASLARLREDFIRSACVRDGFESSVLQNGRMDPSGGHYDAHLLDGFRDSDTFNYEITLDYENAFLDRDLVTALKLSRLPVFISTYEHGWLAWDDHEQCVRTGGARSQSIAYFMSPIFVPTNYDHADAKTKSFMSFLEGHWLSTDHGRKPFLIRAADRDQAAGGRACNVIPPKIIAPEEQANYLLAFHDRTGSPSFIKLQDVARLGAPICLRNVTYYERKGYLYPDINYASLWAHAFLVATKVHNLTFDFYKVNATATLFSPSIERIRPVDLSRTLVNGEVNAALARVNAIVEWCKQFPDDVYITTLGHPLEAEFVTTPKLLLLAMKELDKHGWVRYKAYASDTMEMRKRSNIPRGGRWGNVEGSQV